MEKYSHPILELLMKDPWNKTCFDCGIVYPKWASINNGVFVCLNCAGVHRGLGVNISFIRSLTMDNWDEKQLKFLKCSGNKRLRSLLEEYNIPFDTDIELKYNLNAVDYHRLTLRSEVLGENEPEKPDIISGLERVKTAIRNEKKGKKKCNLYIDIDNSNFISSEGKGKNSLENSHLDDMHIPEKKSFFGKVGSFFEKTKNEIGSKIKEMNLNGKLDKTTSYLDKKTKDVMKSQFVQKIINKTKKVFNNKKNSEEINMNEDSKIYNINNDKHLNNNPSQFPDIPLQEIKDHNQYQHYDYNTYSNSQDIGHFFVNNNYNMTNIDNKEQDINNIFEANKSENVLNNAVPSNTKYAAINTNVDYPTFDDINRYNNYPFDKNNK